MKDTKLTDLQLLLVPIGTNIEILIKKEFLYIELVKVARYGINADTIT